MNVDSENEEYMIDIHKEFNLVLLLLFVGSVVGIGAALLRCINLQMVGNCITIGQLVGFAGFIMLHIYRFQPAGKFCAGDYTKNRDADAPLWSKGSLLLGLMITSWVFIGICFLGCFCVLCVFICKKMR